MAVLIQRDTNNSGRNQVTKSTKKRNHFLDTVLLYVVGFFGLFGSIYLLYLSNEPAQLSLSSTTPTSLFINDLELDTNNEKDSAKTVKAITSFISNK